MVATSAGWGGSVAASGLLASARTALVVLLSFWTVATLLAPRVAPAVAESLEPTPSAVAFRAAVTEEAEQGVDVHDPADPGTEAFKAELLARHQVSAVEDLPINFRGASYEYGEQLSTELYNRHFDRLYAIYQRQEALQRAFALISPTIALQTWSRALAGTDFRAHLDYLRGVENYRYRLVQRLNGWMKDHKPPPGERYILGDIATITRDVSYEAPGVGVAKVASAQAPNLAILLAWTVFGVGLAGASAVRLGRRA